MLFRSLRKFLKRVKHPIAEDLINFEGRNASGVDMTFLNLDVDGYLSFITPANSLKMTEDKWGSDIEKSHNIFNLDNHSDQYTADLITNHHPDVPIYTKSRNQIKIGKLINKLFPKKYTDKEVEDFVNSFKATIDRSGERFEIVQGKDITHWYSGDRYEDLSGNLGRSCMAGPSKAKFFEMYVENPEVCRLLILKKDDKIIGRSLIWKLNSATKVQTKEKLNIEYFMDRQYTSRDSDVVKFKNCADGQGWSYKTNNNYTSFKEVTFKGRDLLVDMTVQLKKSSTPPYNYNYYPFLDTFRRYDPKTGILYNDTFTTDEGPQYKGNYLLSGTDGNKITLT